MMDKTLLVCGLTLFAVFSDVNADFQADCLAAHNHYRRLHGVPELVSDIALQCLSQTWAENLADNNIYKHRPDNTYGENIFLGRGTLNYDARIPVKLWYDGILGYNYNRPGFGLTTGGFTQLVWKNTEKLGCALAVRDSRVVVVANYGPRGNIEGEYRENVLKPVLA